MEKQYTESQLKVINTNSGYNMVLAGPGCGKTDILAERIARAYESGKVELSDMLCLTFTNRAARGMYERIKQRLGDDSSDLFVGNIHRYCSHFLFENNIVPVETSILDEDDTNEILSSEISESDIKELIDYQEIDHTYKLKSLNWKIVNQLLGIERVNGYVKETTVSKIISAVRIKVMDMQHLMFQLNNNHPRNDFYKKDIINSSGLKDYYLFIQDLKDACASIKYDPEKFSELNPAEKLIALAEKYGTYKKKNGLLDFDDLLLLTYDTYLKDVDRKFKRYNWVQIDEIQDLSNFQISLVDLITDISSDFVVLYLGDEQQAIYSFMGASLSTLDFLKSRCLNHIFRLDKNFRSPKYLLDLYNEYAVKELQVDKEFLPEPRDDKKAEFHDICLHEYEGIAQETDRIYDAIIPYMRNEKHKEERTALLVPWNRDAEEISNRLTEKDIPHFKISGLDSFQTVHLKTLLAHFNAVDNDFNLMAWSRLLKQTSAVDTYSQGRHLIEEMRNIGMCPSDLLRDNGSTLGEFAYYFDNEEIVIWDTETTGVDVFNDDIIQIAAIKIRNGIEVPDSFKEIYLRTDKDRIPQRLGKLKNPMVEDYEKAESEGRVVSRADGLKEFMQYIGEDVLLGHNINYDYNILKNNLSRYCGSTYADFETPILDTLKLAHLICQKFKKYKLEYLIETLGLQGKNSHNAKDDIMATFELAKYCREKTEDLLLKQEEFYQRQKIQGIIETFSINYKECYDTTIANLYRLHKKDEPFAIVEEMKKSSELLSKICEFEIVKRFDLILSFLKNDVISKDEPNALKAHFDKHLMDISTFKESDMCASSNFKEKLFISTVHKAKGLEFENVIVMRSVVGRYPHFAHKTDEQREEDKRLFYVAISRAMKRLVVSGFSDPDNSLTPYIMPILHHFTLRSQFGRYLLEIGYDELCITGGGEKRVYKGLKKIFEEEKIRDQFELRSLLTHNRNKLDLIENADFLMSKYGIDH